MVSSRPDHELYSRRRVRSGGPRKSLRWRRELGTSWGNDIASVVVQARVTQRWKWHRWVTTRRTGSRIAGPHLVLTWDGEAEQSDDHKSDDDEPAYSDDNKSGDDEPGYSDDNTSGDDDEFLQELRAEASAITINTRYDEE